MAEPKRANPRVSPIQNEFPSMTDEEFRFFRNLILDKLGINIEDSRRYMLETRLGRRLRFYDFPTWQPYIFLLKSQSNHELEHLTNVITTNKTHFFREMPHFDFLKNTWFQEVTAQGPQTCNFWIAASSYGHEVYSLDMMIRDFNETSLQKITPRILATDIDTEVLTIASKGVYKRGDIENQIDPERTRKYFLQGTGKNAPFLKYMHSQESYFKFRQHNLCEFNANFPMKFDVIFLRNVLIYFNSETVEKVIGKMIHHLKPNGILILGMCESITDMKWDLETLDTSIYRRIK